jgi:hypothetical protein
MLLKPNIESKDGNMLVPLKRETVQKLIPILATGPQYQYYWGEWPDLLKRLIFSAIGAVVAGLVLLPISGGLLKLLVFLLAIAAGLYWFWGPIAIASWRNQEYRRFPYAALWRGKVLDLFVTEELIGVEENVNEKGELVVVENRERRLNVEVGDEEGFTAISQVRLQRNHKNIKPGDVAEMVVLSYQGNFKRIAKTTDIYLPNRDMWLSDYPCLHREFFLEMRPYLQKTPKSKPRRRQTVSAKRRPAMDRKVR